MSLQVFFFLIIHRQSQSFRSLLLYKLLSLLILRLLSSWSPSRSHLVAPLCFLCLRSMVASVPFFHVSHSLTSFGWPLCAPVAGAVLVQWVHCYLHVPSWLLSLTVPSGRWSPGVGLTSLRCRLAFGDGCRSPPLSFFPVRFHILSVRCCGFSTGLAGPRFTHSALCWPRISLVDSVPSPLPSRAFAVGSSGPGVLGFHGSDSLCSLPTLFVFSALLFRGELWDLFFTYFLFIYFLYNGFCFPPSFLYMIAAAWLLHVGESTGWIPTVPTVWSSHPLQTQFIWLEFLCSCLILVTER